MLSIIQIICYKPIQFFNSEKIGLAYITFYAIHNMFKKLYIRESSNQSKPSLGTWDIFIRCEKFVVIIIVIMITISKLLHPITQLSHFMRLNLIPEIRNGLVLCLSNKMIHSDCDTSFIQQNHSALKGKKKSNEFIWRAIIYSNNWVSRKFYLNEEEFKHIVIQNKIKKRIQQI